MSLDKTAVLLLIDVQKGFDEPMWGRRNNPQAEANVAKLIDAWRRTNRPIVHVQHCSVSPNSPLRPGQSGNDLKDEAAPRDGEPVFQKNVNSAFIGTKLESYLRENGFDTLVIAGLTTNHCVSTTARMAGNLGFETYVVDDATATFDRTDHTGRNFSAEEVHAVSLASLHGEFATVTTTGDVLREL